MTHWPRAVFFFKESWIIIYEADKPDLVGDFSDANIPASDYSAEVDLAIANANPATPGFLDGPVVKRVLRDLRVAVLACSGCKHFARVFPAKDLMRPVVVATLNEIIEPTLLLQKIIAG